jgi:hypothetical protein
MEWTGLIWLRIGTSGGFLWIRYWTFGFHEILGSSWGAAQLAAPQEGLSSVSKQVRLERGLLSLVSIIEELLEWKSSGSESGKPRWPVVGIRCADHATPTIRKRWH